MRSKDKMDVLVERMPNYGNKLWMKIQIKNGNTLVPSFEDWFTMIRGLCTCELDKYKNLSDPLKMPREFFNDCFNLDFEWEDLVEKYKIPQRGNNG